MNKVLMVIGASATGKSTRVYALIDFMRQKESFTQITYPDLEGKLHAVGILFPESGVIVIGNAVNARGVERWQGADGYVTLLGGIEAFFQMVYYFFQKGYSVVVEGYSIFNTSKSMPDYFNSIGITRATWALFTYENFEQYQDRIKTRSGREAQQKGVNNFAKNREFKKMQHKIAQQIKSEDYGLNTHTHAAPLTCLGRYLFGDHNQEAYERFCAKQDYINRFSLKSVADGGKLF